MSPIPCLLAWKPMMLCRAALQRARPSYLPQCCCKAKLAPHHLCCFLQWLVGSWCLGPVSSVRGCPSHLSLAQALLPTDAPGAAGRGDSPLFPPPIEEAGPSSCACGIISLAGANACASL